MILTAFGCFLCVLLCVWVGFVDMRGKHSDGKRDCCLGHGVVNLGVSSYNDGFC